MPHTDLIDVVTHEHQVVETLFEELEGHKGHAEGRKDLSDHVIAELVRQWVAEEQFVYPAARKALPNGDELADRQLHQHNEAEAIMKELEKQGPESPHFEQHLADLMDSVRHHMSDEEAHLLPQMREQCREEELEDLGFKVLEAKKYAPTRPHPNAPDKPPANLILGPGAGFIDKIRDAVTGREV
ncbi:hemerythrin domain-containing protein [Glycomyces buryatensis]|uniref:Hemerythrin domain-containing protein n=1 Tax=Glycomyces buryatensis TaxID=2570927 RepID=A0A4S8QEB5_9ACTN|nr:hemerythrin domain-containing protein [Glycomyces buryatensis]THV39539.1 hemerythrin domain-containing protein [Glycomyces buryatensis]